MTDETFEKLSLYAKANYILSEIDNIKEVDDVDVSTNGTDIIINNNEKILEILHDIELTAGSNKKAYQGWCKLNKKSEQQDGMLCAPGIIMDNSNFSLREDLDFILFFFKKDLRNKLKFAIYANLDFDYDKTNEQIIELEKNNYFIDQKYSNIMLRDFKFLENKRLEN